MVEVAALNAFVIQKDGSLPAERKKHDYLEFRVALAEELIGSFCSRQHIGRPRSHDHQQVLRLDNTQSHLPTIDGSSQKCVVCSKVREVKKLKRSEYRHETQMKCGVCVSTYV